MMLKVEAAKKDVQKAEQKLAKAQAALEACRTHLHDLEEKLAQMRATAHVSQNGRQAASTYAHSSISTPTDQVIVVAPAEGQGEAPSQEPAGSDTPSSTPASTHQTETTSPAEGPSEPPQEPATPPSDIYTPLPANPLETPPPVAEQTATPEEPQGLSLDKGYDYDEVRELAEEFFYTLHLRTRGEEAKALARKIGYRARRWVVERTESWLHNFRKLRLRTDRDGALHKAFVSLASALICLSFL